MLNGAEKWRIILRKCSCISGVHYSRYNIRNLSPSAMRFVISLAPKWLTHGPIHSGRRRVGKAAAINYDCRFHLICTFCGEMFFVVSYRSFVRLGLFFILHFKNNLSCWHINTTPHALHQNHGKHVLLSGEAITSQRRTCVTIKRLLIFVFGRMPNAMRNHFGTFHARQPSDKCVCCTINTRSILRYDLRAESVSK